VKNIEKGLRGNMYEHLANGLQTMWQGDIPTCYVNDRSSALQPWMLFDRI